LTWWWVQEWLRGICETICLGSFINLLH
jgi:hypothetical protein